MSEIGKFRARSEGGGGWIGLWIGGFGLFCARIADFSDKLNLKNTLDRESAENVGPDSGLCMSRSLDCGSDH